MSFSKNLLTGFAGLAMLATPIVAQAAGAEKLSLSSQVRAGKAVKGNEAAGGTYIIAGLAVLAVILGIIVAADGKKKATSA